MRVVLILCAVLQLAAVQVVAQDRNLVQGEFGAAGVEERTLANGAKLTVRYSPSGEVVVFTLAGKEAEAFDLFGEPVSRPPIYLEVDFAWDVIRRLSRHKSHSAVKITLPRCSHSLREPGYVESYELGAVSLFFNYSYGRELVSVTGVFW